MDIIDFRKDRGFSLTEILVGMAIGMLGILVIMQVYVTSESQKRTTSTGSDAQTNGTIALYTVERDVRMAGYGFTSAQLSCSNFRTYYDDGSSSGPIAGASTAPLLITDGGTGSDSITMQYSTSMSGAISTTLRSTMPQPSSELNVNSTYGCAINDLVIISQGSDCTLMQLTQVQDTALKLQHNPGGAPSYNPPASYQSDNNWPAYTTGATVSCIGRFTSRTYAVNSSSLQVRDFTSATFTPLVWDIVNMQAQYGVAPAGSQQVNEWVNATGSWAAPSAADIARIKAVRIAIVARSGLLEKNNVTTSCTTIGGTANSGPCAWEDTAAYPAPAIDLSGDPYWQRYRYKVFETIIPLRNVIWANL